MSLFCKATLPNMGICGYNNCHNYKPSYLHVALSDNNYKAFYQQKADKRDTVQKLPTTKAAMTTLGTWSAARGASTDQKGTYIGTQHNATVLQPRHLRLQPS